MKPKTYSLIFTFAYAGFGVSLFIFPNTFLTWFGCPLDIRGEMVARTFSASLSGGAVAHYLFAKIPFKETTWKPLLFSNIIFNGMSAPVMAIATYQGIMNYLGVLPISLNVVLTLFSLYVLLKKVNPQ